MHFTFGLIKNALFIALGITVVLFMVYGMTGTNAWFTDQVVIESNTITTGNIDLTISDTVKSQPSLEPGGEYREALRFCAKNNSSYAMKFRGIFTNVTSPSGMSEKILLRAIMNPTGLVGNYGPVNTSRFDNVPLSVLMSANPHILVDSTVGEPLKSGEKVCFSLLAKLSPTAGNSYQLKPFSANLTLDATQWINTGWLE